MTPTSQTVSGPAFFLLSIIFSPPINEILFHLNREIQILTDSSRCKINSNEGMDQESEVDKSGNEMHDASRLGVLIPKDARPFLLFFF